MSPALKPPSTAQNPSRTRMIPWPGVACVSLCALGLLPWIMAPQTFISDDSYFYLVIARNLALSGEQTFSGVFFTNGVHPLWTYILAVWSYGVSWIDPVLLHGPFVFLPLSIAFFILNIGNYFVSIPGKSRCLCSGQYF